MMTIATVPRNSYSAEFKAKIVLVGLAQKFTIRELCRQNNIAEGNFYSWRKRFISAGIVGLGKTKKTSEKMTKPSNGTNRQTEEMRALKVRFEKFRQKSTPFPVRLSSSEKMLAINLVQASKVSKRSTLNCIKVPRSTYYNWCRKLRETGTLEPYVRKPVYRSVTQREEVKELVFQVMHSPPSDFGFNRTTWKLNELQQAIYSSGLQIGRHSIRRIIKDAGYRWMKARKVLTSNDPDYRQKLVDIQNILGSLGPKDGFFSIDEYGPFAVKQRQGRKLVPPEMAFTVPQFQKSKGALIMTAALELSTNQVTHFYSQKKNTAEMIKLLVLIKSKYNHLDRIFLSWDAASWHISKNLLAKIKSENSKSLISGGPIVEVAPLPAGAQFLNIIESVFSGMSRAIIHNSNYASKEEAMAAIDRYFFERNEYFLQHPKKAGNKIWGKERSTTEFSTSNNCKDPKYR
jgi:transposase-like protein